jgi:RNA polymerase sigma-70 factor, ECF subfamily
MPRNVEFEQLYRSHYRRVFGLCRRLLGRHGHPEDAAQEVFMRAYRAFQSYDRSKPFTGWILAIAGNHCIDVVRRRAKETRLFGDEDVERLGAESEEPTALAKLLSCERATALNAAVAALPDKHRIPLVLAYYEDASYDEIAAALGITRNHVGVLILRAKQSLRRSLCGAPEEASP